MGGSSWSDSSHVARASLRAAAGMSAFAYTDHVAAAIPSSSWTVHDKLNPKGVKFRESRDSAAHPASTAVVVLFDVTGSMNTIPRVLQQKLPGLMSLLIKKGYLEHPQILFGGIGDATCDRAPLQIGQFESGDVEMDDNLSNLLLEGGGGGQSTESYELAAYMIANHTSIDCWEKRGHKGYLFFIGDEAAYPVAKKSEVESVIGDKIEENIPTKRLFDMLCERYEVFFIMPNHGGYDPKGHVGDSWRAIVGQNFLTIEDPAMVCETIAMSIGLCEEAIDLAAGESDLVEAGLDANSAKAVSRSLATIGSGRSIGKASELGTALLDPPDDDDGGPLRL
jgi:hypothetical protein